MSNFPLEPIETAGIDELRALQLKRLKATLQHAYDNSPVYRAKFDAAGVHPGDCRSLNDLAKFPFTTKKDLRDSYPYGMFAVPRAQCARIHASSGTTGKPTVVGYTKNDIDTWAGVVARSIRAAGARPGDMVHVSYGYGLFTGGLGALRRGETGSDRGALWRRADRAPGATHCRFQARHHHGDTQLHAGHRRGVRAPGDERSGFVPAHRHLRRRTLDQ